MTILCFENPPGRNLCFSNSVVSCLLNIPKLNTIFKNHDIDSEYNISVYQELSSLAKLKNFYESSTSSLRYMVQSKCFEAGQWTKNFDNNRQHDAGEFMQSLLEHLINENKLPSHFWDEAFGGLCQNTLTCSCGYTEELQVQQLPEVIPIQISGQCVQSCLDDYFSSEEIVWKCPNCPQLQVRRTSSLITEPEVLILQLMRYKYDEAQQKVNKVHSEVISTPNLILKSGTTYSLHSIINHSGENTQSGHYNLLLFANDGTLLLDDATISYIDFPQEMNKISYICIYKED